MTVPFDRTQAALLEDTLAVVAARTVRAEAKAAAGRA
jgi:hypothetical protein